MANPIPIVASRSRAILMTSSARIPDTTTRLNVRMNIMAPYSCLFLILGINRIYVATAAVPKIPEKVINRLSLLRLFSFYFIKNLLIQTIICILPNINIEVPTITASPPPPNSCARTAIMHPSPPPNIVPMPRLIPLLSVAPDTR